MNFRKLIEKAMFEVRDEFAAIVARKLAELMGDDEPKGRGRPRAAKAEKAKERVAKPTTVRKPRSRAPADHMVAVRERILAVLTVEPMKKQQIVLSARLDEADAARVGSFLRKLKEEGLVTMQGEKALATYTLRKTPTP